MLSKLATTALPHFMRSVMFTDSVHIPLQALQAFATAAEHAYEAGILLARAINIEVSALLNRAYKLSHSPMNF
jgi:hypothetical protein